MKFELLRRLLEWRIEIDHDWSLLPGNCGRELKRRLDDATWEEYARTYVGPEADANWDALFRTCAVGAQRILHDSVRCAMLSGPGAAGTIPG